MGTTLHHTIVSSYDKKESAEFLADILGLEPPETNGHFVTVTVSNGVALDFDNLSNDPRSMHFASDVRSQHYAFQVDDEDFDGIFERVKAKGLTHWADPLRQVPNEINTRHGGRGFYFNGPEGHNYEVFTKADQGSER